MLGDSAFEHLRAARAGPLGKGAALLSALCRYPWMDCFAAPCFSRLRIAAWYLGGIFGQGKVFWPCSLLGFQPFSPKLLPPAVISDSIDRPSAAVPRGCGESQSLLLLFFTCYCYTRADNLFVPVTLVRSCKHLMVFQLYFLYTLLNLRLQMDL